MNGRKIIPIIRPAGNSGAGTICEPRKHCGNWRSCNRCAALRQAHVANIAESIEQQHGQLQFTVIRPDENTAAEIRRIKASLLRRTLLPAGIWTIETGEKFAGLHINIIAPAGNIPRIKGATAFSELIRTTARQAAAYATKQSGAPLPEQYEGRLFGQFGSTREILLRHDMPAMAAAAAIEQQMSGKTGHRDNVTTNGQTIQAPIFSFQTEKIAREEAKITMADYAKIARKHLPNLLKAAAAEATPSRTGLRGQRYP